MEESLLNSHPQTPPQPPRVHEASSEEDTPLLNSINTPMNQEKNAMLKDVSTTDTDHGPDLPLDSSSSRSGSQDDDVGEDSFRIPDDDEHNVVHEPDQMDIDGIDDIDGPKSPNKGSAALVEFPPSTPSTLEAEDEERLARIRAAIEYTRKQYASGSMPIAHTQFVTGRTDPPTTAFTLLSCAERDGLATIICESPYSVTYGLGSPPAPQMYGAMDPQWWVGMSKAEMKAGPFAGAAAVKKAEHRVKEAAKRKEKSEKMGRLKMERKALDEGVRRRKLGLRMWDDEKVKPKKRKRHESSEERELQQADETSGHEKRVESMDDDSDQDFNPGD